MFFLYYSTSVLTSYWGHGTKTNGSIEQDERMEDFVKGKWRVHPSLLGQIRVYFQIWGRLGAPPPTMSSKNQKKNLEITISRKATTIPTTQSKQLLTHKISEGIVVCGTRVFHPIFPSLEVNRGIYLFDSQECCSHQVCQKGSKLVVFRLLGHISTKLYRSQSGPQKKPSASAPGHSNQMELIRDKSTSLASQSQKLLLRWAGFSTPSLLTFMSPM